MDVNDVIKEHGIELAIERITELISKKIDEYQKTREKEVQNELSVLLEDRNKIYNNDRETINKYLI